MLELCPIVGVVFLNDILIIIVIAVFVLNPVPLFYTSVAVRLIFYFLSVFCHINFI